MSVAQLFQEKLVLLNVDVPQLNELFDIVTDFLFDQQLVTSDYGAALKEREQQFPTGLATQSLMIALPHTDSAYVKHPFVCVVRTKDALEVLQMGDNRPLQVQHFFFLGICEEAGFSQVVLLSALMDLFTNERFVTGYKEASTAKDIIQTIQNEVKEEVAW